MSNINVGDYIVIVNWYPDKYYKDDVFVVTSITPGYRDTLNCDSLFRKESFSFTKNQFIRKITSSAAQKRIKNAIKELEQKKDFLHIRLENLILLKNNI